MTALFEHRAPLIVTVAFVVAATIYAAVAEGLVQASAFAPVFIGIWLLERKRNA